MASAIPGQVFTFHVLFVDDENIVVDGITDATGTVFRYDDTGTKVVLKGTTSMTEDTTETGRWVLTYAIPTSISSGTTIYGLMHATDPRNGAQMVVEQEVLLLDGGGGGGGGSTCGLRAQFVKGG